MRQEFISGYIYYQQLVSAEQIKTVIEKVNNLSNAQTYYFFRYSHAVSGICMEIPSQRGEIEGQMFNAVCELRWKKYKTGYEVLILSKEQFELEGFEQLTGDWKICDQNAYWHDLNETKFPKGFKFTKINNQDIKPEDIAIRQRYFQDSATATIHFVALTVNEK